MSRQKEIYQELQSLSDPKYKEFHGGLVPGEENLLGVRIPALRRYARELFTKSGGRADILLQEIGDSCYEEITLQGMIIGLQRNVPSEMFFLHRSKDSFPKSETGPFAIHSAPV